MAGRRKDSKNRVLRTGESERKSGGYQYRWTTPDNKRQYIYAKTLKELREKEAQIQKDLADGICTDYQKTTINDFYKIWFELKKGCKKTTILQYEYIYDHYVRPDFGNHKIADVRKSDVRRFYNRLIDECQLKTATVDSIHVVLRQVFNMAQEDNVIRVNPCDGALKDIKKIHDSSKKRKALTLGQQKLFLEFLKSSKTYSRWYPIFVVMLGTGLRVGEITGLRWDDIDFEKNVINVTHTIIYVNKKNYIKNCHFVVNTPKTKSGYRTIPILPSVKEALLEEKNNQELAGIKCKMSIDGYTNFVFLNDRGNVYRTETLDRAIKRIVRDCNQEVIKKSKSKNEKPVLLPQFSCHILRHTFTTRLCESDVNVKIMQEVLGHANIQTTLDIYADITEEFKHHTFGKLDDFIRL